MRGLTRRWLPCPVAPENGASGAGLGRLEPLVRRLLVARGLGGGEQAAAFCNPKLTDLHDPSLLPDADRAAERLLHALSAREPIVIYGDYDTDGITATAILFHTLRAVDPGAQVTTYVPHRIDEGYGVHGDALEELARGGAKVVVSVDCGVTAFAAAAQGKAAGLDLIITDHHNLASEEHAAEAKHSGIAGESVPDCFAVVHPRRQGSRYPFADLSGAGVAFKLAWRIGTLAAGGGAGSRVEPEMRAVLLDMLALASLGTIADIVPLVGENRVIARFGLKSLRSTRLQGLTALINASGLGGESIDAEQVGFKLAPRLNACGRLGHAQEAVELLTTAPPARAKAIAESLSKLNDERRRMEKSIAEQAVEMAVAAGMTTDERRAIVLAHEDWHPGVVGIVCSRLVEQFHRPTILMQRLDGICQGSGRSIDGYHLHEGMASCAGMLERFGGHDMAAGLALRAERLEEFRDAFTAHATARLSPEDLIPTLRADCEASVEELTPLAIEQIGQLGPFGRANATPLVMLRDVVVARRPETFGAHGAHLSVHVRSGEREMRLVAWRWGERAREIDSGSVIHAIVEPKVSLWQGRVRVEPVVRDFAAG